MKNIERAVELFEGGYNCSQAILAAYGPSLGLTEREALKVAAGFGGGMGCSGGLCGAISGAFMVIGLKYGAADADKAAKVKTYEMVARAMRMFEKQAGSLNCRELLGFDMSTPEGRLRAREQGAFDVCTQFVRGAAEILDAVIQDEAKEE
ncbi:MAG: C_GCAxxG_C_C family protein [Phycisphaerae bacterium]|nr:C_GCAxxG_C_C family protein [Phycisphaerae bacterium]